MNSRSCCGTSIAVAKPVRCRVLVGLYPAKALIAHQINQIAADRLQAVLHAIEQFRIVGLWWQIHRKIDDLRVTRDGTMPPFRRRAHKCALTDPRFNQAALLRLDIAARHRRKIDIEPARELALRRQPIRRSKLAAADILGDRVGDSEITRLAEPGQKRRPFGHFSLRARLFQFARRELKLTVYCCKRAVPTNLLFAASYVLFVCGKTHFQRLNMHFISAGVAQICRCRKKRNVFRAETGGRN